MTNMIHYLLLYVLLVVSGFGFAAIGPWWLPLLPVFLIGAWWTGRRTLSAAAAFLIGGLALSTVWLVAAWWIDSGDVTGLAGKIGELFRASVPALDGISGQTLVFALTGIISFLLGGITGFAGVCVRR